MKFAVPKHIMPRVARLLPPSGMFHLIGRGNNDVRIFRCRNDFLHFKATLLRFMPKSLLAIQHYILMHTHFHLLAWVDDTFHLAKIMKATLISYQHYYRRKYGYKGHLWHSRYRSILIKNEPQFLQCGRYIESNAIHAGLCEDPAGYAWSSYQYNASGKNDPLIQTVIEMPGGKKWIHKVGYDGWRKFVMAGIDLDYQTLKKKFEQENYRNSW